MPKTEGRFLRKGVCWNMGEARLKHHWKELKNGNHTNRHIESQG